MTTQADITPRYVDLLVNVTANGAGPWVLMLNNTLAEQGLCQFIVTGTFGGGSVKLQWTPDDGVTVIDGTTAQSTTALAVARLPTPIVMVRALVAGATNPILNATLRASS